MLHNDDAALKEWYTGPTLIDTLGEYERRFTGKTATNAADKVEVPTRPYESAFRIPVSNVFKGQTAVASGVAVSGRLCSGVVQVGDRVRAVPGDEVATIRSETIIPPYGAKTGSPQRSRSTTTRRPTPWPAKT